MRSLQEKQVEIVCQACGKPVVYTYTGGRQRLYCSDCTADKYNPIGVCTICGKEFTKDSLPGKHGRKRTTCSGKCQAEAQHQYRENKKRWWRDVYYPKNKEKLSKKNVQWANDNRDRVSELARNCRAAKKALEKD